MRNRRGGCCSSWLARWGRFCRWSAAEGEGRAGNDAGWAMETGIFWPAWWGAAGLRRAASGSVRAGRTTYFEVWALDKVADPIARQGRTLGWLRRRRTPTLV